MSSSTAIAVASLGVTLALALTLRWQSGRHVTTAGFWFEDVTFELPHLQAAGLGGPIDQGEQRTIETLARAEVANAFARFRFDLSESRGSSYTVRVVQQFPPSRRLPFGAAGQSLAVAPLGGHGSVSFLMLGSLAISYAPPHADRATIIEGIGRGIGRAAAHELAHQLLPRVAIHASTDERSYEFELAARPGQYYGEMHWDLAQPYLLKRLGTH
jgi:hypothetical protein